MKKLVSFFSMLILSLSLASCGANNATSFDAGSFDNKSYINNWINIKIQQTNGWVTIPDDQLAQMYSNPSNVIVGLDSSKNKDFEKSQATDLYPIGFINTDTNATLFVAIEKTTLDSSKSLNSYIDKLKTNIKDLESQGLVYTVKDPKDVKIGEFECIQVEASADFNGSKLIQNYYIKAKDKYIFAMITTAPSDKGIEAVNQLINNIKKSN